MPIPQINNKNIQSWRSQKAKRRKPVVRHDSFSAVKTKRGSKTSNSLGFFTASLKKKILWGVGITGLAGIISVVIFVAWLSRDLPDPNRLIEREIAQSTQILDRTGETVLYEIHGDQKRTVINLEDVPNYVKQATIAIEDKNYYNHGGISLWGIFRGVVVRILTGQSPQGGSTLTQQFVKNAILTNERSVTRKIKEWILSYQLEKSYSKDEILQMYFNEIPYGSTAYGVEAASQRFFGKSVRNISIAEAAILAALPQAPSKYSPYGPNKDMLLGRQKYVIDLMSEQGYISEDQAEEAKQTEINFEPPITNIIAPHFVMYVKEILSGRYGEKMIEQGGLKIYTTLDLYKQNIAEEVISDIAPKNQERYGANNAALISIDPKTGQILAMVGSRDYFDDEIDGQVNITTSARQPGSSLKPLVYAASFLKGYTPDTILYDVVTNFSNDKSKPYEPHNYDNEERGPVTIRKALAGSLNVPAVKAIYLAGVDNVIDLAQDLGYSTLYDRDRFGLSLVLGGGEVKPIEHVNAFGAFAREGLIYPATAILKVEDKDGKILEEFESKEKQALDPKVARQINSILSDNGARSYVFGESNWLTLGSRPVAAKTGTTNDYRDAWTIGYTPSLVTGVWVGNNDNTEMKRGAAGGVVAAPIWHDYMDRVLGDTPIETFKNPEPIKTGKPILDGEAGEPIVYKINRSTGLLATEFTPSELIEEKTYFEPHSILYYVDKDDPRGAAPENLQKDPQFELWESRIAQWAEKIASSATSTLATDRPPSEYDNIHTAENQPQLKIITPHNNDLVTTPFLIARVEVSAARGLNRVEYYINDNLFDTVNHYPYTLEKSLNFLPNGFYSLKVRACDDVDNCQSESVEFNLSVPGQTNSSQELNISILSPSSGLALSHIDFPLIFTFNLTEPKLTASINIYSQSENDSTPKLIGSIKNINGDTAVFKWLDTPSSGVYKVNAEAVGWNKKTAKTEVTTLIVTSNIQDPVDNSSL